VHANVHAAEQVSLFFVNRTSGNRKNLRFGDMDAPTQTLQQDIHLGAGKVRIYPDPDLLNCRTRPLSSGTRRVRRTLALTPAQRGQSIVELALVTPLLLLLLVGTIEVGRFAYYSIVVSNAARAGAQYGAQSLATAADTAGISTAAKNDAQNITGLTVTSSQLCGCTGAGLSGNCPATGCGASHPLVYVQVTASGSFTSLFSYPGIPKTFDVTSTEKMQVAQ
jgi:Flp pilus assembly protein TadG